MRLGFLTLTLAGLWLSGVSGRAQGTVNFNNFVPAAGIDAPVFLGCEPNKAIGVQFVAQLLAGPSAAILEPVGKPIPFLTGSLAGYIAGQTRTIPNIPPGGPAVVQMVAWDATRFTFYEGARTAGEF